MTTRRKALKLSATGELYTDESDLQKACVRFFRTVYRRYEKLLFSIPNGGKLGGKLGKKGHPIQASILKAEGMTSGVADLLLSVARCGLHGLYLEAKTPEGAWKAEQREFAQAVLQEGYGYVLFRSRNQFETQVQDYLNGTYKQVPYEQINKASRAKYAGFDYRKSV